MIWACALRDDVLLWIRHADRGDDHSVRGPTEERMSTLSEFLRHGRPAAVLAAALLVSVALVSVAFSQAQPTLLRMSLDSRLEGPLSMFLVAQDRGYFREEGLDVVIDEGAVPLDPINRVASGSHDIGFADINALIRYRDQ